MALLDHGIVIDLSACTYYVLNTDEDVDYDVEGYTIPRHVFFDEIVLVQQVVNSFALWAALE